MQRFDDSPKGALLGIALMVVVGTVVTVLAVLLGARNTGYALTYGMLAFMLTLVVILLAPRR